MRRPFAALLLATFLSCMAPEAAPGQERIVPRIGAHDGYDRVVIDWPFSVDYDVDVDGREITVRFARMAEIDVAPVVRRLGARVSGGARIGLSRWDGAELRARGRRTASPFPQRSLGRSGSRAQDGRRAGRSGEHAASCAGACQAFSRRPFATATGTFCALRGQAASSRSRPRRSAPGAASRASTRVGLAATRSTRCTCARAASPDNCGADAAGSGARTSRRRARRGRRLRAVECRLCGGFRDGARLVFREASRGACARGYLQRGLAAPDAR
jgi:hypothetical protein